MKKNILTLVLAFVAIISHAQKQQQLSEVEKLRIEARKKQQLPEVEMFMSEMQKKENNSFGNRFNITAKGNMTFIANNIISVDAKDNLDNPTIGNGYKNLQYVNADNDSNTFSSSRATLSGIPLCDNKADILFAGLYWSAIYPYDNWERQGKRDEDFNKIKIKYPRTNTYSSIDDGIKVFDKGGDGEKPYVCFKDLTKEIQELNDPNGDYWIANVKATTGGTTSGLGSSAGWTLVIVYKNKKETNKKFYVFDGHSKVRKASGQTSNNVDVLVDGFRTVPYGPVRAEFLVGALEGDRGISGDQIQIKAPEGTNFHRLQAPQARYVYGNYVYVNNQYNFFDGSITNNGKFPKRFPDSKNTLGFDIDMFKLNNTNKKYLKNDQGNTKLRFTTTGDAYYPFLFGMSVEVIEPKIQLIKSVEDGAGNDIAGTDVNLGNELWYRVNFKNVGTDNAKNVQIVDVLPVNVDLVESSIQMPPGLTYKKEIEGDKMKLIFDVKDDDLVKERGGTYSIRFKVQVVTSCDNLRDACSNIIKNQAYANYEGDKSPIKVVEDYSFSGTDSCGNGIKGSSNFLADVSECRSQVTAEILCNSKEGVVLKAGEKFSNYKWTDESGKIIGTERKIKVFKEGVYTVEKTGAANCLDGVQVFKVDSFGKQPNPLKTQDFFDEVVICPNTGEEFGKIYMCGNQPPRVITLPYESDSVTKFSWKKLKKGPTCSDTVNKDCPNIDTGCDWEVVGSELTKGFSEEGEYKLQVDYGDCSETYHFKINIAPLSPKVTTENITCKDDGKIIVNNIPNTGYMFRLYNITKSRYENVAQHSNVFFVKEPGDYHVEITSQNSSDKSCNFDTKKINITDERIKINVPQPDEILCFGGETTIDVSVKTVASQYTYILVDKDGKELSKIKKTAMSHTFKKIKEGTYSVIVRTENCEDKVTVNITSSTKLTIDAIKGKDIACKDGASDGIIVLKVAGGKPNYSFRGWKDGQLLDSGNFFTATQYAVKKGEEGVYKFEVHDGNNCIATSNEVVVGIIPELRFTPKVKVISCVGMLGGSITIDVEGDNLPYNIEYSIDNKKSWNTTGVFTGLKPDNYTVNIRATLKNDQLGGGLTDKYICEYTLNDLKITVNHLKATVKTEQPSCGNSGKITVTAEGGFGDYEFAFVNAGKTPVENDFIKSNSHTIPDDIPNTEKYDVYVRDEQRCIVSLGEYTINPVPITPNIKATVKYACNGIAKIIVTDENDIILDSKYTYSLDGGNTTQNNHVFENISTGAYFVTVISSDGACEKKKGVLVVSGKAFSAKVVNTEMNKCAGASQGIIAIHAENYDVSYKYSVDGGTTWKSTTAAVIEIKNLPSKTYNIWVATSDEKCKKDLGVIEITAPKPIEITTSMEIVSGCEDKAKADITVKASGGIPPYQYSIDEGKSWQNSQVFKNQTGKIVSNKIHVKDQNACIGIYDKIISIPLLEKVTHEANVIGCYDENNKGQIKVTPKGGTGNYIFYINGVITNVTNIGGTPISYTINGLQPNTYKVKVQDAFTCESQETTHIINDKLEVFTKFVRDISCEDGKIFVDAKGGDGDYVYAFVKEGVIPKDGEFNISNTYTVPVGTPTPVKYDVYVRDKKGGNEYCEHSVKGIAIDTTPTWDIKDIVSIDPLCRDKGGVSFDIVGSTGMFFDIEIFDSSNKSINQDRKKIDGITTKVTASFPNLLPGNYTIEVVDAYGCMKQGQVIVKPSIQLEIKIKDALPDNCTVDTSKTGFDFIGISPSDYPAPYTLQCTSDWNKNQWKDFNEINRKFRGFNSGDVVYPALRVINKSTGEIICYEYTRHEIAHHVEGLILNPVVSPTDCSSGFAVTLVALKGKAPFEFSLGTPYDWQPHDNDSPIQNQPDQKRTKTYKNLVPGRTYEFFVKDATGCIKRNSDDVYAKYTPSVLIKPTAVKGTCSGASDGSITFDIENTKNDLKIPYNWKIFEKNPSGKDKEVASVNGETQVKITHNGLSSGVYYVEVYNQVGGCSFGSKDVEILEGAPIQGSIAKVRDITCRTAGVVDISNIIGGTGQYKYELVVTNAKGITLQSWSTSIIVPYKSIEDPLKPVTVNVKIRDDFECSKDLGTVSLKVNTPKIMDVKLTQVCTSRTLEIIASEGVGPYQYSIDNGQTYENTNIFTGELSGDYEILVKDANGCTASRTVKGISPILDFEILPISELTCDKKARLSLNVISGPSNYGYVIKNKINGKEEAKGDFNSSKENIEIGVAGKYEITLTNKKTNCNLTKEFEVNSKVLPDITHTVSNSTCQGSNSGVISVTAKNNGILPLEYTISPDPNGVGWISTNEFVNLPPNTYELTAKGNNGCTTTIKGIEITEYKKITIPIPIEKGFGCSVGNDVTISASIEVPNSGTNLITGGSGNYVRIQFIDTKGTTDEKDDQIVQDDTRLIYTLTDQSGGDYKINVYDDKGCIGSTTATIKPFEKLLSANIKVDKSIDCIAGENITVSYQSNLSIESSKIMYSVVNIDTKQEFKDDKIKGQFEGLPTGFYEVKVKNTKTGCTLIKLHEVAKKPSLFMVLKDVRDVNCYNGNTGSFSIHVSSLGYKGDYIYEVIDQNGIKVQDLTLDGREKCDVKNLKAGSYDVRVTMKDTPFCVEERTLTIKSPSKVLAISYKSTLISCGNPNSGEAVLNVTGGWGNYVFLLKNETTNIIHHNYSDATGIEKTNDGYKLTVKGLNSGKYQGIVKDKNGEGCDKIIRFELLPPQDIKHDKPAVTINKCKGEEEATITINNVSGGQVTSLNDYSYLLANEAGFVIRPQQKSNEFKELRAGKYYVTIFGKYACKSTPIEVEIKDPQKLEISTEIISSLTCNKSLAEVKVQGYGGTGKYTYSVNDETDISSTNNVFTLGEGLYKFYVKDEEGCTQESSLIFISKYEALQATLDTTHANITCHGESGASLSANASGGLDNYTYELLDADDKMLQPVQKSKTFSGLGEGTYKIKVYSTNDKGDVCSKVTVPYTIVSVPKIILTESHTDATCIDEADGTLTLSVKGRKIEECRFNVSLKDGYYHHPRQFVEDFKFDDLRAGTYTVTIRDKNGCEAAIEVEIKEPTEIQISQAAVVQQVCITDPTPIIEISVNGGAVPGKKAHYIVSVNDKDLPNLYQEGVITLGEKEGILSGDAYRIGFRVNGDCDAEYTDSLVIDTPVNLDLKTKLSYTCPRGNTVKAWVQETYKGLVIYTLTKGGGIIHSNDTGVFTNLIAGDDYQITVEHIEKGCPVTKGIDPVENYKELVLEFDKSEKNKLIFNTSFGVPPYQYSVDDDGFTTENEILIYETRDYKVKVMDSRGCELELTVLGEYISIKIPNIFTPDGDGQNDYWYPIDVEGYHDLQVQISDRYGRVVKKISGVQSASSKTFGLQKNTTSTLRNSRHSRGVIVPEKYNTNGWDGTYEGQKLPSGDYWYIIKYKELSGKQRQIMGHFTLYR